MPDQALKNDRFSWPDDPWARVWLKKQLGVINGDLPLSSVPLVYPGYWQWVDNNCQYP